MKLSDVMSHMDLAAWPMAALVIFLGVFVLVASRAFRTSRADINRFARIPVDED
ncbi:MAG: hypothetical protein LW650_00540 [Planctomycetaceae bacterium]|jgi:hypothetical protein|nr:hypothetical protein [Phycisphaerales bacterium]MCE2652027.1 hypothetical protein [Planctomycetaceae bacterium]